LKELLSIDLTLASMFVRHVVAAWVHLYWSSPAITLPRMGSISDPLDSAQYRRAPRGSPRSGFHDVAANTKGAAVEAGVVALVLNVHEPAKKVAPEP
jgi:hypothetical protein